MPDAPRATPWPSLSLVKDEQDSPLMDPDELDRQLLAEIRRGMMDRFDFFVDRYKTRLFRFLHMRSGSCEVAEDLTQEVFLKVLRVRGSDSAQEIRTARVSTWLFTIARNCLVDHHRAQQRRKRAYASFMRRSPRDSTLDRTLDPMTCAVLQEEHARVAAWLAHLPDDQREVLSLRLFGDLALAEIATITNAPLPTVKSRLRYALAKISTLLPKESHP